MTTVNLPTYEQQQTILDKLNTGLGTDWSKYLPYQAKYNIVSPPINTFLKVYEITGGGFIDYLKVELYCRGTKTTHLKITVDSEVIVDISHLMNAAENTGSGFSYTFTSGATDSAVANSNNLPFISNTQGSAGKNFNTATKQLPLFFKYNLKIEISTPDDTATSQHVDFKGGLINGNS